VSHNPVLESLTQLRINSRRAEGVTYRCRGRGALLSLPHGGLRQDVIHTKLFQKYIRDNIIWWFRWSKDKGLPVKCMADLVFVYGCTLVTSWAAAAFDDDAAGAQVSLASRTLNNGGASFYWSKIHGTVEYHDSQLDPVCSLRFLPLPFSDPILFYQKNNQYATQNRCVFIKCLRAKRILFRVAIGVCTSGVGVRGVGTRGVGARGVCVISNFDPPSLPRSTSPPDPITRGLPPLSLSLDVSTRSLFLLVRALSALSSLGISTRWLFLLVQALSSWVRFLEDRFDVSPREQHGSEPLARPGSTSSLNSPRENLSTSHQGDIQVLDVPELPAVPEVCCFV
jgi:hypothetical protein